METNAPQGFFGRLGGLLGPQGLTPEEQTQMGRQGLLQMGLGILANNHDRYNAGAAVGSGLLAGISAMQKSGKDLIDRRTGTTDPATFRAQHMAAIAAGYEPGSEGYQNFFKRANGELARASSAGYQPVKFKGGDGRERIGAFNGRTGNIDTPDGYSFKPGEVQITGFANPYEGEFQPQGAPDAGLSGTPVGGPLDFASDAQQFASLGIPVSSTIRSAEKNRSVGGVSNSYHLTGEAMDIAPRSPQEKAQAQEYWRGKGYQVIDEGDHLHIEPPGRGMTSSRLGGDQGMPTFTPAPVFQRPSATAGVNPFVGRRPEDEAAAIEQAKTNVQLGALPAELGMRTDAAVRQATEIERGKAGVELDTKQATRARDAGTALDLISEARRLLPNATGGTLGAAADATAGFFGHATQGAQANAALKTIAGQMTSKMPRMEGPQSDRDVQMYKDMAGDVGNANLPVKIRLAALAQIERLNEKYANNPSGRSGPAAGVVEDGYRFKGGDPADPNNWERL